MGSIVTSHDEKIFAECNCGCSIISIYNDGSDQEFYLTHYGQSEDNQPDFIFSTRAKFETFVHLLRKASEHTRSGNHDATSPFDDIIIGVIDGRDEDKECICVVADGADYVGILKYHKRYKKFKKFFSVDGQVEYRKCKCDWDLCLDSWHADELADECEALLHRNYNGDEEDCFSEVE